MTEINWSEEPEQLTIERAREIIKSVRGREYTIQNVILWVKKHKLGWQPSKWGHWIVDRDKLKEFLNGK